MIEAIKLDQCDPDELGGLDESCAIADRTHQALRRRLPPGREKSPRVWKDQPGHLDSLFALKGDFAWPSRDCLPVLVAITDAEQPSPPAWPGGPNVRLFKSRGESRERF